MTESRHTTRKTVEGRSHASALLQALANVCALYAVSLIACALLVSVPASAQVASYGDKSMGERNDQPPPLLGKVNITQRLNQQIPLGGHFLDSEGRRTTLAPYFGQRPVILALVYYRCRMLCSEELNWLVGALKMVSFTPGKEYDVLAVSINPEETPQDSSKAKQVYLKRYGKQETAGGWHFLTGDEASIQALAAATGFGYTKVPGPDGKLTEYAHASAIQILTPDGRLAQYYLGVEYSPKDIRLGLVEASEHHIGSPVDNILTYCYHYDPQLNRHSLIIARVVQLGGLLTVFCLGGFMFLMFRYDRRQNHAPGPTGGSRVRL